MFRCFDNGETLERLQEEQKPQEFNKYCKMLMAGITSLCTKKGEAEVNFKRKQKAVL
tara:strand:- start:172 stop:342 length:171 start_codon:yes stop_codon:yes gene_type:complete